MKAANFAIQTPKVNDVTLATTFTTLGISAGKLGFKVRDTTVELGSKQAQWIADTKALSRCLFDPPGHNGECLLSLDDMAQDTLLSQIKYVFGVPVRFVNEEDVVRFVCEKGEPESDGEEVDPIAEEFTPVTVARRPPYPPDSK